MMKYTFSLLFLFIVWTSFGQNQTSPQQDNTSHGYTEAQFNEAATMPIGMTRNVKQARNGDILIASFLGVFRYDARLPDGQGTSLPTGQAGFTNLTSKISSPRFSNFWDVLEDRKGNLWFGTRNSGVYCYDGKSLPTGQASFQHFTTKDGLVNNNGTHIYEDKAGNIWVGASRYDGESFRNFTTKDGFPSNSIRLLLEDKTGKLWFGAQGEDMFVYDARLNGEVGKKKKFTVLKNKDGKAFNNVWSIIEDKKGNIWFGNVDGLWRYDGSTFTKVSQKWVYAILEDKKGNIWTTGEALSRYDQKTLYDKNPTVTEIISGLPMLLGISEANDGSIWFGSMVGVYRYDGKTITDVKGKEVHM